MKIIGELLFLVAFVFITFGISITQQDTAFKLLELGLFYSFIGAIALGNSHRDD